jgi:thiol-disulfide isomerase/thioredoxin
MRIGIILLAYTFVLMRVIIVALFAVLLSCNSKDKPSVVAQSSSGEPFVTVDFEEYEAYLESLDTEVAVVNFWATWCKPCVKELPHFEQIGAAYKDRDVKVILVSLDFPDQIERLEQFIERKKIRSTVVWLDDGRANEWIPKVDQDWSGAIPATIIYTEDKRSFYEQSFTYEELEKELKGFL